MENSDEFYKKKYSKYKQKYIDTQQLYSKELDGGWLRDEFIIFVPFENYKLVRDIFSIGTEDKPTIINDIKGFFILLSDNSYKTFNTSQKLRKCSNNEIVEQNFWLGKKDNTKAYIGLGYYSDNNGNNKKKSIEEAYIQARNSTYGKSPKEKINGYRFFVLKSVIQGYSIRFPYHLEQINENSEIIEQENVHNDTGVPVGDEEAALLLANDEE